MQSSLPAEPTRRNVKAADIVVSAEVAKIVEVGVSPTARSDHWIREIEGLAFRRRTSRRWRIGDLTRHAGSGGASHRFERCVAGASWTCDHQGDS
jgi:hypothetical protein